MLEMIAEIKEVDSKLESVELGTIGSGVFGGLTPEILRFIISALRLVKMFFIGKKKKKIVDIIGIIEGILGIIANEKD